MEAEWQSGRKIKKKKKFERKKKQAMILIARSNYDMVSALYIH